MAAAVRRRRRGGDRVIANHIPTTTGRVRAVCEFCDRKSRPVEAGRDGQPATEPAGWTVARFPANHRHGDGSHGSTWTCTSCRRLREQRQRDGVRPLLVPSADRVAARAAILPGQLALLEVPGGQLTLL